MTREQILAELAQEVEEAVRKARRRLRRVRANTVAREPRRAAKEPVTA